MKEGTSGALIECDVMLKRTTHPKTPAEVREALNNQNSPINKAMTNAIINHVSVEIAVQNILEKLADS